MDRLKTNHDIFKKIYFPFAEATPGDYYAVKLSSKKKPVYFISHDYSASEKSHYLIAESIEDFFMQLGKAKVRSDKSAKGNSKIEKVWLSTELKNMAKTFKKKKS